MKLGLLTYATKTGLGYQTKAIYDHLKPTKTMLVNLKAYNGMPVQDWYDADVVCLGIPTEVDIDRFLDGLEVVFYCETPLNYYLVERARKLGIVTICQPNFEFLDYRMSPYLPKPDVFALPSLWHVEQYHPNIYPNVVHLPVPTASLPPRFITKAQTFIHIAGRPAVHDRNGTLLFIEAAKIAAQHEDLDFIIYCQQPTATMHTLLEGTEIDLVEEVPEIADLYKHGDVLVLPRRYGGLCLPAQEAIVSGLPVLMPDIDPNNRWMPKDWLMPVLKKPTSFISRGRVYAYSTDVSAMAQKMLDWSRHPEVVREAHKRALAMRESMTWEAMLPRYEQFFKGLVKARK